jgi:hypothetical protein
MKLPKKLAKYLQNHPDSPQAATLRRLMASVADGASFPLGELYALDYEAFGLAIKFLEDWRLGQYATHPALYARDILEYAEWPFPRQ